MHICNRFNIFIKMSLVKIKLFNSRFKFQIYLTNKLFEKVIASEANYRKKNMIFFKLQSIRLDFDNYNII